MTSPMKPPRVDRYAYWGDPPPEPSPRLAWWLHRITQEGWTPNRRISTEGYDGTAEFFGVYMWEYLNVLFVALQGSCLVASSFQQPEVVAWLDEHGVDSSWVTKP